MPLSWNEIKGRALKFSHEWAEETSEDAEAKSFWNDFFEVFGIKRRRIATFEEPVRKSDGRGGYIDLLWRGILLVEHKSRGKNLDSAFQQAKDYFPGLKDQDLPHYVVVSDFARFRLFDLDDGTHQEFPLEELHKNVKLFGFIAGYPKAGAVKPEDPVNRQAAERMGKLHDKLKHIGYTGHTLEVYLVRLLFCLFAEDTGIFERRQLQDLIEQRTAEDGSDLALWLANLFQTLNIPEGVRLKNLDEQLAAFPYVNGKLFAENLALASFDTEMRELFIECCALDWSKISPAIFGALFQSVMDKKLRRNLGAHYTSESNILKVIEPLFIDDLRAVFSRVKRSSAQLMEFHKRLAALKFFDPACGCGNFLVIAYRELRLLELEVLRILYKKHESGFLDVSNIVWVDVDQFYGIEIEEFPAQIAQVALWLTDHQMNMRVSEEFGQYFRRLPLKKSPNIVCASALTQDWRAVAPNVDYLFGNPPFIGSKMLNEVQRSEMKAIFTGVKGAGVLDYVAAWYLKAMNYMDGRQSAKTAFVSTSSITQGEQVGILWSELLRHGAKIHFAHRTFSWSNEASGVAAVHCVIIGFALHDAEKKMLYDYEHTKGEPHALTVRNINPYLVDSLDLLLENRSKALCDVPKIGIGNKPIDGGYYLFTDTERTAFLANEPQAAPYFRRWLGADEFLKGYQRWCLWLGNCPPDKLRTMPHVMKRMEAVRLFRLGRGPNSRGKKAEKAPPESTKLLAGTPTRFHVENMPADIFLLVPKVSSESRAYIPIAFMQPDTLVSDLAFIIPNASLYHFGLLASNMHMAWVRQVCGRLESRYRYSAGIVYNNFPWPQAVKDKQKTAIETAAQGILDARHKFPDASLADLYGPLAMPPELVKAHQSLNKAVDKAYGRTFSSDAERVAFLFDLYQYYTSLFPRKTSKRSK